VWFPRTCKGGPEANRHENMSCFSDGPALISTGRKLRTIKHELKTRTSKPTTHRNMSSFGKRSSAPLDAEVAQAPQTYPTETCNLSGVMFQPHPPIFHVPHAIFIHAPWPIHDVLDLFSTLHCYRIVFLPNSNIFINTPY